MVALYVISKFLDGPQHDAIYNAQFVKSTASS